MTRRAAGVRDWVALARPHHWVKNAFVLAPLLFSGLFVEWPAVRSALLAAAAFCLAASAVYAVNDVMDCEADRAHPIKRQRPVAAGRIFPGQALVFAAVLGALALTIAAVVSPLVAALVAAYLGLNLAYSWRLKRVVILDVFTIAAFFVLRLLAGAAAVEVRASIWLLVIRSKVF